MNLAQLIRLPGFDREAYEADLRAFKSQQAAERKAEKVDMEAVGEARARGTARGNNALSNQAQSTYC